MKRSWILGLLGAVAITAGAVPALAVAQPVELKGDVKLDKLVTVGGQTQHVYSAPEVVVPGDRLLFSTAYRNAGTAPVKNFVVTNPIPAGVTLASEGAEMHEVSVDGGKTWGKLAALTVPAGTTRRAAVPSDVTHLRWTLAVLAPGAQGSVTYNAIVR